METGSCLCYVRDLRDAERFGFRHRRSCEQLPRTALCLLVSILRLLSLSAFYFERCCRVQAYQSAAQGLGIVRYKIAVL